MSDINFQTAIDEILDSDFIIYYADQLTAFSSIESLAQELNCQFPEDFRQLAHSRLNGLYVEAKEEVWPRKQGGSYWMLQHALFVFGVEAKLPDWINIKHKTIEFRKQSKTDLTPCLQTISSVDPYCFTKDGKLVKWCHETFEEKELKHSFYEVLCQELQTIKRNKERLKGN